jgi:hypothetical protein
MHSLAMQDVQESSRIPLCWAGAAPVVTFRSAAHRSSEQDVQELRRKGLISPLLVLQFWTMQSIRDDPVWLVSEKPLKAPPAVEPVTMQLIRIFPVPEAKLNGVQVVEVEFTVCETQLTKRLLMVPVPAIMWRAGFPLQVMLLQLIKEQLLVLLGKLKPVYVAEPA